MSMPSQLTAWKQANLEIAHSETSGQEATWLLNWGLEHDGSLRQKNMAKGILPMRLDQDLDRKLCRFLRHVV